MARGHGVVADLDRRRKISRGIHPLLGQLLDLQRDHRRRRLRAGIEPREILRDEGLRLHRIEVADDDADEIAGAVVGVPVILSLLERVAVQVARPADHRPRIAARRPEHRVELLLEAARRRAVGAEPPFLVHDVALGIKLAKDAVVKPVALHPGPELELVGGHRDEVAGEVVAGEGIHAAATGLRVDLVKLVLHDRGSVGAAGAAALLGLDEGIELAAEHAQLLGVVGGIPCVVDLAAIQTLILLCPDQPVDLVADRLLLGPILRILGGIAGADGVGALEHHVLEEVADAGDARSFVDAPHLRHPAGADDIRLVAPRHEQKLHAVGQGKLLDGHLLGQDGRRGGRGGQHEKETAGEAAQHGLVPGVSGNLFIPLARGQRPLHEGEHDLEHNQAHDRPLDPQGAAVLHQIERRLGCS